MTSPADIKERIKTIGWLQQEIVDTLHAAAEAVRVRETLITKLTDGLAAELKAARDLALAKATADAMREHRVNVGELHSDFSDVLRGLAQTTYPEPYKPIRAKWALVENRT